MSSVPVARDAKTHLERCVEHMESGNRLLALNDEWFAVCYFYSAYHMVKAAMHADSIFEDPTRCAAVDANLTLDSRYAEHHSGGTGVGGRSPGINQIVMKLYKTIRVPYHRLHGASIAVRYGHGLGDQYHRDTVKSDFEVVRREYLAGKIVAPV